MLAAKRSAILDVGPKPVPVQGGIVEGSGTTVALTLPAAVGPGNLVAGQVSWVAGTALTSIKDDKNNTYKLVDFITGGGLSTGTFYLENITNLPKTITATFAGSVGFSSLTADECSNLATSAALDGFASQFQSAPGTGLNAASSGAVVTQYDGDWIYGTMIGPNTAAAGFPAFRLRQMNIDGESSEDCIQSKAGSIAATFTVASAGSPTWVQMMAFLSRRATSSGNFFSQDGASSPVNGGRCGLYVSSTDTTWFAWEAYGDAGSGYQRLVMVTTYNHTTKTWTPNVVAGTATIPNASVDQHGIPWLVRDSVTGRIYIFYGAHTSTNLQVAMTTTVNDPSGWTATALTNATYGAITFPAVYAISGSLYLFWNGAGTGSSSQESLKVLVGTINGTTGAITWGSAKNLVDPGGTTWLLMAWTSRQVSSTKIGFFLLEGPTFPSSNTPNSYYVVYDTSTGNIENVNAGTTVASGSQPVNLTSLNANFAVYSNTSLWVLRFAVDGLGTIRCFIVDASASAAILYETHWTGSAWSTPLSLYTFPAGFPGNIEAVVNNGGGIDLYFTDGARQDVSSLYVTGAGNLLRLSVDTSGNWDSAPTRVFSAGVYPIFGMSIIDAASAGARLVFSESALNAPTPTGNIRSFALGDSGLLRR